MDITTRNGLVMYSQPSDQQIADERAVQLSQIRQIIAWVRQDGTPRMPSLAEWTAAPARADAA